MKSSAALADWLGDPERQLQSSLPADDLARRWRVHPLIADLEAELAGMSVQTAEGVLAAAERFIARRDELRQLIREMIQAAAADPFFRPPVPPVNSDINCGYMLFSQPSLTIALGTTSADALAAKKSGKRGPTVIHFTGLVTSFHWLKAGNATLSFWEADPIEGSFTGASSGRCRFVERRRMSDGESFVMDGRRQSFVIEHATSEMLCLQAMVQAERAPLAVQYDSQTLEFVGASSTDEASSRIQMMVTLIRLLDRQEAVPQIVELLHASPHFYTRWHIMRELLALDAEAALPHLAAMAEGDPHPEVRAAAGQTMKLFFPEHEKAA